MKLTYYFVRHGQTLFNTVHRLQGASDSPLTERGIHEAKDIASALRRVDFKAIYCSSAERAIDTAEIIAKYHPTLTVQPYKQLKEYSFGVFDGMKYEEIQEKIDAYYDEASGSYTCGEGIDNFRKRMDEMMQITQANAKDGDTILLVSHCAFFGLMMKYLCQNEDYLTRLFHGDKKTIKNCQCAIIEYEDGKYTLQAAPMYASDIRKQTPKHVEFYYCRHGATLFNDWMRCQGHCDSALTEEGIYHIKKTSHALRNVPFTRAYTSSLERARDTATIILEPHHMVAKSDKRLREVFYGDFEAIDTVAYSKRIDEIHVEENWDCVNGEPKEHIVMRLEELLNEIADECEDGEVVLLVSHALIYRCLLKFIFNIKNYTGRLAPNGYPFAPNAGIFTFAYNNGVFEILHYMEDADEYTKRTSGEVL